MDIVTSFSALRARPLPRVILVEGARCAGKDHLIARLDDYQSYEVLKPRKQFLDRMTGGVKGLPAGLEIQQSHLWTLDVLRQLDVKCVVNRSMLSSLYFDGFDQERFTLWSNLVRTIGAMVLLVQPSLVEHQRRIQRAGRAAEAESILAERSGIARHASEVPGLVVFSEPSA